jgi:uncharacterized protein YjbJ (UPF0337 family)
MPGETAFRADRERVGDRRSEERGDRMGEQMDKAKGHAKEAVGDMTDNERLEREGKIDRMGGEVKGRAEDAKDKVGEGVDSVKEKMRDDD